MSADGRRLPVCRRMWKRWWFTIGADQREQLVERQCLLPRGTASDLGWLAL